MSDYMNTYWTAFYTKPRNEKKAAERRFRFAYLKPKHNMPRPSLPRLPFKSELPNKANFIAIIAGAFDIISGISFAIYGVYLLSQIF